MHIGSQITDLGPMEAAFRLLADFVNVLRSDGHTISHVDFGGGLGVPYYEDRAAPPEPLAYAAMVKRVTHNLGCTLMFEPGRMPGQRGQKGQKGQQGEQGQGQQGDADSGEDGLGEADSAMGDADSRLGDGNADGAVDSQGRALEALRKGAQDLAQAMQQDGEGQDNGPGSRPGRQQSGGNQTDPLGRPLHGRELGDDLSVKIPGEIDVQRVRKILEELRRRLADPQRPQIELDYIERLLKDY